MNARLLGILAAGVVLAVGTPVAAQQRPQVSESESSRSSGPSCVVAAVATDCGGSAIGPVGATVFAPPLVVAPFPVFGPVFGGDDAGRGDVDVDRSTRSGTATAR